jgi:hypothetical protein
MTARSRNKVCLGLGLLGLLCAVPIVFGDDPPPDRKVRVSVVVILASETDTTTDKKLECIAREMTKMHPKLKGFRMGNLACKSLKIGDANVFDLAEGKTTTITIQQAADKMDRIRLKVGPPKMGEITYSTPCGKFLPILTPYRTKANETLIIAIRVQPCNGK